jgi:hypothetical protein
MSMSKNKDLAKEYLSSLKKTNDYMDEREMCEFWNFLLFI